MLPCLWESIGVSFLCVRHLNSIVDIFIQMDISNHQYMLLYDCLVDTDCSLWNFHRSTICYQFWCMMWSKYCKMFLVHKTWLSTTWAYSTMICIQLMIWKWIVGVSRLFVVYFKLVVYGWIVDGMNCMKNWSSSVKLFSNRSPYFSFRMYGMECESWYWIESYFSFEWKWDSMWIMIFLSFVWIEVMEK